MPMVKFGDVVDRVNYKVDKDNTDLEYYVGGEHFSSGEMTLSDRGIIKGSTIGPMFYFGFKVGDILFVSRNPHLKKAAMVDFDGVCSEKTFVLKTKNEEKLLQQYLAIVMQTDDFWQFLSDNKSGSVNFFVNWSTLVKYEFDLPDTVEQDRLAKILWAAEDVKQKYCLSLEKADLLYNSLLATYIDKAQKFTSIEKEFYINQNTLTNKTKPNLEFQYIDITSVEPKKLGELSIIKFEKSPSRARRIVKNGDILISGVRPNLKAFVRIFKDDYIASTGFIVLTPKNELMAQFLYHLIFSDDFQNYCNQFIVGTNYPAINSSDLSKYRIPLYNENELLNIVTKLNLIDNQIKSLNKSNLDIDSIQRSITNSIQRRSTNV